MKYTITALFLLSAIFSMGQDTITIRHKDRLLYTAKINGSILTANATITTPQGWEMAGDTSVAHCLQGIVPLSGTLYFKPYVAPWWEPWAIVMGAYLCAAVGLLLGLNIALWRLRKRGAMVIAFLMISGAGMAQKDFTARTWASMDRAIYKQQRQIDSLLARTRYQDHLEKRLDSLTIAHRNLYGSLYGNNGYLEHNNQWRNFQIGEYQDIIKRLDSLEEKCVEMDCEIFNRQHVLAYNNIKSLQNDMADMSLHNWINGNRLDSLIKDLRDRPALRMGLQEGPVFRDAPFWQDGWPRPQMLQMYSAGHIIRVIYRNPVIFYSSPTGDSLYQWGRDPSFPRGFIQPLSGEGYDTGVTVIDPTTTPSLSQDIIKKEGHRKKQKIKISQPVIDFSIDQGSTIGKPTFSGLTTDSTGRVTSHNGKSSKPIPVKP